MLDATRDDQEFARAEIDRAFSVILPVVHRESAVDHQEKFVLRLMFVPDEVAGKLYKLDMLAVQFGYDLGGPMLMELREL